MKNLFEKTKKEETQEVTEETEEVEATEVEEKEKKKTVPTWLKVVAAGIGVGIGAFGLSKIFGHGGGSTEYIDLDEMVDSDDSEEPTEAPTEAESTETQVESAE